MNFLKPLRGPWIVTQTFDEHNQRRIDNGWKYYNGALDLGCPVGTPIYASMDGKIEVRSDPNGYGNHIKQTNGIWSIIYGHMSDFTVASGVTVKAGDQIGFSGNTGNSSGPHLHWEIRKNNIPVDPEKMLEQNQPDPGTPPVVTQPPVVNPPQELKMPVIPKIPMVEIIVDGPLNIRTQPGTSGRAVGQLFLGMAVPVIATRNVGDDLWIQIGYAQWIAGKYQGENYVKALDSYL